MSVAVSFLLTHWRKILALVLLLLLLLARCAAEQDSTTCGPSTGAPHAGPLAYPLDPNVDIGSGYRTPDRPDHRGVDFPVPEGSPIYALADGTVTAAQDTGVEGFSAWIVISHVIDGTPMSTVYGHMNPGGVLVKVGDQVTAGQLIARSGDSGESTGPHLHFEIWHGDRLGAGTDTDPTPYLQRARQAATSGGTSPAPDTNQQAAVADSARDRNAEIVISTGKDMGAPDQAIVIALSVGLVESELRNLASEKVPESASYPNDGIAPGDALSIGIMQQQAGMGYGTVAEIMDPAHAATEFYKRLLATDWQAKDFTVAAADVQRPRADLRGKYGQREAEARDLYTRLQGVAPSGSPGRCGPTGGTRGPAAPGDAGTGAAIVAAARSEIGEPYVWGGGDAQGPTGGGFDCSGLTLYAVAQATGGAILLPHYTGDPGNPGQMGQGQPVADLAQAQPGDLVFFGAGGSAEHVGVYEGGGLMIHSPTEGQTVTEAPVTAGGQLIAVRRYTSPDTGQQQPHPTGPAINAAALPKESR
ncbi:peptidoglycan DD-metalloendopeptidase family protein [Nocardia sp. alder85J]|uniref:peptidoglycan DD-metalloendopeptidase family protein n=1 Tax=Nocardia sp. alder85J TaxID=2862949 RepID=UPI001CD777F4|nr:peptidoglycan DD-metalloendopeptidase family protein [Nocardia sp. alder85J]MCX4099098.1 peptidoglycan DD-metalloendopeptidase family protein [Nocardia sp. alder85J]